MKFKSLIWVVLIATVTLQGCAPEIFTSPNFATVKRKHKTVALLPFDVTVSMKKLPKGVTVEQVKADEEKTAFTAQSNAYTYFLKEMGRDKYTVDFQDIDKTNATLVKSDINYSALKSKTKDELCKLLGVDAVITGKITLEKPMNEGAAIALGLLVGFWGNTNKVITNLSIHDSMDGKLLWKYDWEANGSVGSSTESLTRALMRNVSKKFPYKKG